MKGNGRKPPRRIPAVLTQEEVARIVGGVAQATSPTAIRNQAILRLMLHTGLRARELRELTVGQIDWASGRFKIRGKGGRERVLRISPSDLDLIKLYLGTRVPSSMPGVPSSNRLFTSLDGQRPICDRWLRTMVKREALNAGVEKDIHPHTLRHTFATNLLRKTKNLFMVSKSLGHADLSTTQIYLHVEDEELEEAMVELAEGDL